MLAVKKRVSYNPWKALGNDSGAEQAASNLLVFLLFCLMLDGVFNEEIIYIKKHNDENRNN